MDEIQLPEYDEYFTVAALILANQPAPTLARIIRKFNIGYRRSQKILDQLDKEGFISLKDNKVLVTSGKEVQEKSRLYESRCTDPIFTALESRILICDKK